MFMTPQQNGGQQGGFGQQPNNFSFQQPFGGGGHTMGGGFSNQPMFDPQMYGAMQQQMGAFGGQPGQGFGGGFMQGFGQQGYAQPGNFSAFGNNFAGTAPRAGGLMGAYMQQGIAPALQQMQQMYNSPSIAQDIASLDRRQPPRVQRREQIGDRMANATPMAIPAAVPAAAPAPAATPATAAAPAPAAAQPLPFSSVVRRTADGGVTGQRRSMVRRRVAIPNA
jgi:hypothetical protein